MLGIGSSGLAGVFVWMVVGLTFFRVADEIASVLAIGLLFLLKAAGLVLLVVTIMFVVWSLYKIFK